MTSIRKPARLAMTGGLSPRQHMWLVIRTYRAGFTCYQVARRSKQEDSAVGEYLKALRLGGFIKPTRTFKRGDEVVFELVKDNGVEAPNLNAKGQPSRLGYRSEAMWRTLRILGRATPEQVAAQVEATGDKVEVSSVERYFRDLQAAGYLERGDRYFQFLPRRYTGPRAPMVRRTEGRQVYDPNLDQVVWDSLAMPEQPEPESQELRWARIEAEQLRERTAMAFELLEDWIQASHSADDVQCSLAAATRDLIGEPDREVCHGLA